MSAGCSTPAPPASFARTTHVQLNDTTVLRCLRAFATEHHVQARTTLLLLYLSLTERDGMKRFYVTYSRTHPRFQSELPRFYTESDSLLVGIYGGAEGYLEPDTLALAEWQRHLAAHGVTLRNYFMLTHYPEWEVTVSEKMVRIAKHHNY